LDREGNGLYRGAEDVRPRGGKRAGADDDGEEGPDQDVRESVDVPGDRRAVGTSTRR
jgi:hypothetical protein